MSMDISTNVQTETWLHIPACKEEGMHEYLNNIQMESWLHIPARKRVCKTL